MPEERNPARRRRGGAGGELAGGIFIARVVSPAAAAAAAAAQPRRHRRFSAEEVKENVLPSGLARGRKSLLPAWYPRTPLRDITHLVNVLEERRNRIRAARIEQRNLNAELTSPASLEHIPPNQSSLSDDFDTFPSSTPVAGTRSIAALSPTLQSSSISTNLAPSGLKPTKTRQTLSSSMDNIESPASEYLNKIPKGPARNTAQRILMSMR